MRRIVPILLTALSLSACAPVGGAWRTGWTERAASDQIMLVSSKPRTLGHERLDAQSKVYGDLEKFLSMRGWPDFLAESSNDGRRYLILYYLDHRQAFAARTRRSDDYTIEFAGPYPITDKENELLSGLRKKFRQQTAE